jgi:endonuclease YncB( thermonuclease family)
MTARMPSILIAALVAMPLAAPSTGLADRWYEYKDCRLLEDEYYDGDSFHVKTKSNHYIFRLYFVDAPELDRRVPSRVAEQAEYWDIEETKVLKIALRAKSFVREFLSDGFTVYSKRHDARGASERDRFFGMIESEGKYLSEALVEQGLARVYGARTSLPDGKESRKFIAQLKVLERKAKREERGAWQRPGLKNRRRRMTPELSMSEAVLTSTLPVYRIERPRLYLGRIPRGHKINVHGMHTPVFVKISFVHSGATNEVLCYRHALRTSTGKR